MRPLPRQFDGFFGQIDGGDLGAVAREIHGVGTQATADFEHLFPAPALEIRELRDMRLHHVFTPLHFIEVLAGTHLFLRMAKIARPVIPVFFDRRQRHFFEKIDCAHAI